MKKINLEINDKLSKEPKIAPRLRKNLNYHEELSDTLQRLLNAMEPGTYIRPHKHENPDKREIFILLRGKSVVVCFNNDGTVQEHTLLDPKNGNFGVEIPERVWHSIIVLEHGSVVFEVKDGPFEPISDKNFAPWSPPEGGPGCADFNNKLLRTIGLGV
jgi:cupin fold WbuC family metalloprotein